MNIIDKTITSARDTQIPVTIVEADAYPARLLLCVHGFKANRSEDGRFLTVARQLASEGVTSIMMGFPGCDVSKEDFLYYTLDNCLADIEVCRKYMEDHYDLKEGIGMIGYSMGGRLTEIYIATHPEVTCIGLWAAASYPGFNGEKSFLGGDLAKMKAEAATRGWCDFHNEFDDTDIRLSAELFANMEDYDPGEGLKGYTGAAIIVHGTQDVTVPYETSKAAYEKLINTARKKLVSVEGADHGFGAWNQRPDLSAQLTDATIAFFRENFA